MSANFYEEPSGTILAYARCGISSTDIPGVYLKACPSTDEVTRIEASVRTLCGATGGASSAQSKSSNVSSRKRGSTKLVKQRSVDSQASPSFSSSPENQQLVVFTKASTNRSAEPEPVSPQIPDGALVQGSPSLTRNPRP
jgi:hypothetical protein